MSVLTKEEIIAEINFPTGFDVFQLQPHAFDLRIADTVLLRAGQHLLVKSYDQVSLPKDIMAVVYPRSSLNRQEVTLDMTGIVDAGYAGHLMLPLTAHKDIEIKRGTRIASLVFHRLSMPAVTKESKYHLSSGEYIPDKGDEVAYIEAGDIEGLRDKYRL